MAEYSHTVTEREKRDRVVEHLQKDEMFEADIDVWGYDGIKVFSDIGGYGVGRLEEFGYSLRFTCNGDLVFFKVRKEA